MTSIPIVRVACLLMSFVITGALAGRAEPSREKMDLVSRTFTVRYHDVLDVVALIQPAITSRGVYSVQPRLKAVTITDTPEAIRRIALLIAGYDLPPRSVDLLVQLMRAEEGSAERSTKQRRSRRIGLPPSVIQDLTKWGVITPIGSAAISTAENESGVVAMGDRFRVRFTVGAISMDIGVVRMERFILERVDPEREEGKGGDVYKPVMDLVLNLRDHQTTVLGSTSSQDSREALFVSVKADIVEP